MVRIAILALFAVFSAGFAHADIVVGSKREAVIAELGKPSSAARRGTREILIYPKGVRLELDGDSVVDIKGYVPTGFTSAPVAAPAQSTAPAPPAPVAKTEPTTAPPMAAHPPEIRVGQPRAEPVDHGEPAAPSLGFAVAVAGVMLAAQFLLTFVALKIAFHSHQMDALWSGIFAITGIDVALQALIAAIVYFQSGEVRLGAAGTGLPGLVMIWSIRHFCFDQRWKRAFATTSMVKIAAILLNFGLLALVTRFGD